MKITKIEANGLVTVTGKLSGDYTVIITDPANGKSPFMFPQSVFPVDISSLLQDYNNLKGQKIKIEIISQSNPHEFDEVEFVAGTEWDANTPKTKPSAKPQIPHQPPTQPTDKKIRMVGLAIGISLGLVLLVAMWLMIDPIGRYKKYQQSQVSPASNPPPVSDVAARIKNDIAVESQMTEPQSSSIVITNSLSGLKGGVNIVSTGHGTTNIIIVVGRDYKVGSTGADKPEWPEGYKPDRREILKPDNSLKIGEKEDQIFTLAPKEDVAFILPENWNVKTFPDRTFLSNEYLCSIDNDIDEGFGKLRDGRMIRFKNLSSRPMKIGVRCTKIHQITDSIWEGSKH
jgi:hypothetical protein